MNGAKKYIVGSIALTASLTAFGYIEHRDVTENKWRKIFFKNSIYGICVPVSIIVPLFYHDKIDLLVNDKRSLWTITKTFLTSDCDCKLPPPT